MKTSRTTKDKLQGLKVASPCQSSWEAMTGDGRRRLCQECDKHVYDFAQLTPREVAGVIGAHRGEVCGRVTRDGYGRLVTLEPPALTADPFAPRRASPLAAAVVTAVLGLGSAAWNVSASSPAPAEKGAGTRPEDDRAERTGRTGDTTCFLGGTVASQAGEPLVDAEVRLYGQLDSQERSGRTDAAGRFSFPTLPAGIYGIWVSARGHNTAYRQDVLLAAGEKRQVGLTVPDEVWQAIAANEPASPPLGGVIAMPEVPLYRVYDEADLAVLAVAGKSVTVHQEEYSWEVRTDLVISAVLKGDTRERVISVFHDQRPDEDGEARFAPGTPVLAFLDSREAESGRGSDGYVPSDLLHGLRALDEAEVDAYRQRVEAIERIPGEGVARPEAILEWLVATVEDPATRKEAIQELSAAVGQLDYKAERSGAASEAYARDLRGVFTDFVAAGGRPGDEPDQAILAAFLTGAQRERLTTALLHTPGLEEADLELYDLAARWHEDRLLPWLTRKLEAGAPSGETGLRLLRTIAGALDDPFLMDLQRKGEERIGNLEQERYGAGDDEAAQRHIDAEVAAAERELRRQFLEALRQLNK